MAGNFLETGTVNHSFEGYSYDKVIAELNADMEENDRKIENIRQMGESASDEETRAMLEAEYRNCLENQKSIRDGLELAREYPDEFPVLYAMIAREEADGSGASFELNEVLAETDEIVTEAQDVMPKGKQLELMCELPDVGRFGIVVTPYDKPGEDSEQLKARITFPDKTIENLNEARLKAILEFCEKKGLSIYDLSIPYKDGVIDIDEKLAELTQKILDARRLEDVEKPGPSLENDDDSNYIILTPEVKDIELEGVHSGKKNKKPTKKEINIDFIRNEMIDFIENDLKKTRGRSYFEKTKNIDGLKTYVFSLYDKPNKNNEKLDGLKDKNGNYVPTYAYRLYVSQNPKTGSFVFGYATPGGKKIDDTMAGDFIGVIKKTGVTHVRFSDISSADKGVWMMACAEKGLVPIGISINAAKGKAMVEAARKKLSTEEFIEFKYRLADQLIENAQNKCKDKNDPTYGLPKSERDFISGLRTARDFENFRIAYEDGLYAKVIDQIDKGSKDSQKGAAITFGSMKALRTVFDIYFGHQSETFAKRIEDYKNMLSQEEYEALKRIPANKKMGELSTEDFMYIYDAILPRHIEDSEHEILLAYARELKRTPRRADGVVLASDLFPRAKGALTEINITLTRNGIDTLTLPNEHKGLEFERPDDLNERLNTNTRSSTSTNIIPTPNQNAR